ncbi:hypothetical protein KIW84_013071 [Lathyrus oleraceus]|uniref:Uncharacterized protein n=1 Tax=Pisum sativum TaxID=3888 RepID=A0A9D5BJB2_PEA|nr:hypothetical protein KIW84_013071 [Pisum sativum]
MDSKQQAASSSKVAKQAALGFVKRTLERYHQFEDAGKSCFNEPLFKDMFLAASSQRLPTVSSHATSHDASEMIDKGTWLDDARTIPPRESSHETKSNIVDSTDTCSNCCEYTTNIDPGQLMAFLTAMSDRQPVSIITDQNRAIQAAISQRTLPLFFKKYEKALESWIEKEIEADFETICTTPVLRTPSPMETGYQSLYKKNSFEVSGRAS